MLKHRRYSSRRIEGLHRVFWPFVLIISVGGVLVVGWTVYWLLPQSYSATSSMLVSSQPDIVAAIIAGGAGNLAGATGRYGRSG